MNEPKGDIDIRFLFIDKPFPGWLKKYFDETTLALVASDFDVPDGDTRWVRITRKGNESPRRFISPTRCYPEPEEWQEA